MICTVRTPLRVSLFGGGTDYPEYFLRKPGAVLGFAIDKYIYISAMRLNSYVDYRYRLSYSKVELVDRVADIEHPVVRALLGHYHWDEPTDFSVQAHLPASAGLGSSSAFTVGFINLISRLMEVPRTRMELAREAIHTEQVLIRENVGVQDQLHATFGGMNRFDFHGDSFRITPINASGAALSTLMDWMVLVYTGIKRRATAVVAEQVQNTRFGKVDSELADLLALVNEGQVLLESGDAEMPRRIGEILHRGWQIKRRLAPGISLQEIDALYELCRANGAIGGKLCGAGGGGFLLMVVPPERRQAFEVAVDARRCVRIGIDFLGSTALL